MIVKEAFTHRYGHGGTVHVPAGTQLQPIGDEPGMFWVSPFTFPSGSIDWHDAVHYGIRVPATNAVEP